MILAMLLVIMAAVTIAFPRVSEQRDRDKTNREHNEENTQDNSEPDENRHVYLRVWFE
jgi:hypothetical protein